MLASAAVLKTGRGWLLVEEPEAQLHPRVQAVVPVVLYSLAAAGVRLVVTTHSPVVAGVAATLARLARESPEKLRDAVTSLLQRFSGETADETAARLAEALPRLDVRFYHVGDGKTVPKTPEELEQEGIPTHTEVPIELAKWDIETRRF
jgi:predicted ATP-binding protein involved in virulence